MEQDSKRRLKSVKGKSLQQTFQGSLLSRPSQTIAQIYLFNHSLCLQTYFPKCKMISCTWSQQFAEELKKETGVIEILKIHLVFVFALQYLFFLNKGHKIMEGRISNNMTNFDCCDGSLQPKTCQRCTYCKAGLQSS